MELAIEAMIIFLIPFDGRASERSKQPNRARRLSMSKKRRSTRIISRHQTLHGVGICSIQAAVCLVVHFLLLGFNAYSFTPTLKEPGHLVAGLSNWEFGRFEVYRVNGLLLKK
jgi:hypothetical protein